MNSTVYCPKCGTKGVVPEEYLGKRIQCSKCKKEFKAAPADTGKAAKIDKQPKVKLSRKTMLTLCWVAAAVGIVWMIWPEVRKSDFGRQAERQIASFVKGLKNDNRQHEQMPDDNNPPAAQEQVISVSIAELAADCKNELAAKEKYGGKRIEVTGQLTWKQEYAGMFPVQVMRLVDPNDKNSTIGCDRYLDPLKPSPELQKYEGLLTVQGTCDGSDKLKNCSILTTTDEMKRSIQAAEAVEAATKLKAIEEFEAGLLKATNLPLLSDQESVVSLHDRNVELQEKIKAVKKNIDDSYAVIVSTKLQAFLGGIREYTVECRFRSVYKNRLAKLLIGDPVVIRGELDIHQASYGGDTIILNHCVLVE